MLTLFFAQLALAQPIYFASAKADIQGWNALEFCSNVGKADRDASARYYLQKEADKSCGARQAKVADDTVQITGLCDTNMGPPHYVILATGRFDCVNP